MRWLAVIALLISSGAASAATPEYLIASPGASAAAGEPFELIVVSTAGGPLPD